MFGCASFAGADPALHAEALAYLRHFHPAPDDIAPRALPERYVSMDTMSIEAIDKKRAFMALPVLVKGYLRIGGVIGDGAVLDPDFNTTDVSVVVRTKGVGDKYVSRYVPERDKDKS